jgi:coenzyme F420-reducing hydrogenase delta subunit
MVLACYDGACRSVDGNRWAEKRVNAVRAILEEAGIAGWRLAFHNIAPSMPVDLLQWLAEFREPVSAQEPQQGASA